MLLLPAFFAYTGQRTQIGLVSTGTEWMRVGVIILIASPGKFVGSLAAAPVLDWLNRDGALLADREPDAVLAAAAGTHVHR